MWQSKYDESLDQVYYVNSDDGSVLFDLPCEVHTAKTKQSNFCKLMRPKLLSRISLALTLGRLKSHELKPQDPVVPVTLAAPQHFDYSMALSGEDSFMLENPLNLYNLDASSVLSDESIQLFYSNIETNDIYYDYEHSVYYDDKSLQYENYDKEQERHELRLQILKELY